MATMELKPVKLPVSALWKQGHFTNNPSIFRSEYAWRTVFLFQSKVCSGEIYEQLLAAEAKDSTDLDAIDAIIGNNGWTHNTCDACYQKTRDPVVSLGNGETEFYLCNACIDAAKQLILKG